MNMYWSIKTGRWREKFEVSTDDGVKVYLDVHNSCSDNLTHISHFWLNPEHAREIATALISAADIAERNKK